MTYEKDSLRNEEKVATHVGAHGDHPVGGMVGAAVGGIAGGVAAGAAQGAILGTTIGPIGTAAGAVVGGVIGALAGKAIAQDINPTTEDVYWRENYHTRPYVDTATAADYDSSYGPAYRYGVDAYTTYVGREFDEIEPELRNQWEAKRAQSKLDWEKAQPATRDAYNRLYANRRQDV